MKRAFAVLAALTVACSGVQSDVAGDRGPGATDSSVVAQCLEPDLTPYRSWWSETTEGYESRVLREIDGDQAQWVFTSDDGETRDVRANIILGDNTWNLIDGTWKTFPVTPIRWPLLVWVNGYVNGPGVVRHLIAGQRAEVAGIPATIYTGGVEEMTAAFPGKMRARELSPGGTSYTYWVDDCGALLKADVVIELGGEELRIAVDAELPTTYRYRYEVYDVGAEFEIVPPSVGFLPEIPDPAVA